MSALLGLSGCPDGASPARPALGPGWTPLQVALGQERCLHARPCGQSRGWWWETQPFHLAVGSTRVFSVVLLTVIYVLVDFWRERERGTDLFHLPICSLTVWCVFP